MRMSNNQLPARIRAELGRQNISQSELARRIGRSQPWTWNRLNGQIELTVKDVEQIALALDVPLSALLPDTKASA